MKHGDVELAEEGPSRLFSLTSPFLDVRQRRLLAVSMVEVLDHGGQTRVAEAGVRRLLSLRHECPSCAAEACF